MADESAFFEVLGNPDLWRLIKSFMFPGKKSSTIDNYKDGDMAATNGYLTLIKAKSLTFSIKAMDFAAYKGYLEVVKYLHENRKEGCSVWAINVAAREGHLEVVKYLHENGKECTTYAMNWAAFQGQLEIVKYLREGRRMYHGRDGRGGRQRSLRSG